MREGVFLFGISIFSHIFVAKYRTMTVANFNFDRKYTYADYLQWTFEEAVELIRGRIFKMAAPLLNHQTVSSNLNYLFQGYLKGKSYKVFAAPFEVRLPKPHTQRKSNRDIETVVQPDICVVCDMQKLDRRGCIGAPDLIVEILSKSTATTDIKDKYDVYQECGVREYWIVSIPDRFVNVFRLNDAGQYMPDMRPYVVSDTIRVGIFPDLEISVADIFEGMMDFQDDAE